MLCGKFKFIHFQLLKVETRRKCPEFALALDKIKHSLGEQKYLLRDITWCIHTFLILFELERTIFHSSLTTNKHRNDKKI